MLSLLPMGSILREGNLHSSNAEPTSHGLGNHKERDNSCSVNIWGTLGKLLVRVSLGHIIPELITVIKGGKEEGLGLEQKHRGWTVPTKEREALMSEERSKGQRDPRATSDCSLQLASPSTPPHSQQLRTFVLMG